MSRGRGGGGASRGGASSAAKFPSLGDLADAQNPVFVGAGAGLGSEDGQPPIELPLPFDPSTPDMLHIINAGRRIKAAVRHSPYYLVSAEERRAGHPTHKLSSISTDLSFFPAELHEVHDPSKRRTERIEAHKKAKMDKMGKEELAQYLAKYANEEGKLPDDPLDDADPLLDQEDYDEELEEDDNDYVEEGVWDDDYEAVGGGGGEEGGGGGDYD
ncbi:hypothetical protein HDU93_009059 [Gonapodya sp. JEL0774]|nr:hypothetical protein HDU93_009059 [Gonapodya sp. JEL0774]